jgi:NADH-quinone oxidoreductase subunit I
MYGVGILKGLQVTLKHFVETFVDDLRWFGRRNGIEAFQTKQSLQGKGMYTVQYPEEKIAVPERFRFIPFLVTYNEDDPEYAGKDWCTSCGICAKVCPPQCIWIVQTKDPATGRPKPEPEAFFIDIDVCMNCGYCAEYCPFDAIKMDHDYELASYDRTSYHIHDKARLSKPVSYWQSIAPTQAAEELADRGGYDHKDIQKLRKKAGLTATRTGPTSDKPQAAPVAAAPAPAPAIAVATAPVTPAPVAAAPAAPAAEAAPAAATADGKKIVRRRSATAPGSEGQPAAAAPATPAVPAAVVPAAPVVQAAPPIPPPVAAAPAPTEPPPAAPASAEGGEKKVIRRRNNPPPKKD